MLYNEILKFKNKYPSTISFRTKKHCEVLEKHLNPGENIIYAFTGQKNKNSISIPNTFVIALTNKRLLFARKRLLFGYFFYAITPDMFNDLKVSSGIIWGKIMIDTVCNCTKLNEEIDALTAELKVVSELVSECVNENARKKQSQDAYTKKYNSLVRRYERAEKRLNKATAEREDKVNKEHELRMFFETLKNKPQLIDTWDENLWITLVEK